MDDNVFENRSHTIIACIRMSVTVNLQVSFDTCKQLKKNRTVRFFTE